MRSKINSLQFLSFLFSAGKHHRYIERVLIWTASILIKLSGWVLKHVLPENGPWVHSQWSCSIQCWCREQLMTEFSILPGVSSCEQVWAPSAFCQSFDEKQIHCRCCWIFIFIFIFLTGEYQCWKKCTTNIMLSTLIMLKINNCRVWVVIWLAHLTANNNRYSGRMLSIWIFLLIRSIEFTEWISSSVFYLLDICIHTTPVI